jgi:hypothetical protein
VSSDGSPQLEDSVHCTARTQQSLADRRHSVADPPVVSDSLSDSFVFRLSLSSAGKEGEEGLAGGMERNNVTMCEFYSQALLFSLCPTSLPLLLFHLSGRSTAVISITLSVCHSLSSPMPQHQWQYRSPHRHGSLDSIQGPLKMIRNHNISSADSSSNT